MMKKISFSIFLLFTLQTCNLFSQCVTSIDSDYNAWISVDIDDRWLVTGGEDFIEITDLYSPQYNSLVITPSDASGINFGMNEAVSVSGNRIIVGARGDNSKGKDSGAAYLYEFDGQFWNETKFLASDGEANDMYGFSVGISGEKFIIGAIQEGEQFSGAAYLYEWDGAKWQETKVKASQPSAGDFFGSSVAISGNKFVVGARGYIGSARTGGAFFYKISGSQLIEQFVVGGGITRGDFGYSVSIDGNFAVIGSTTELQNEDNKGAARVYQYSGTRWFEVKKLVAPPEYIYGGIGNYVDNSGGNIIACAGSGQPVIFKMKNNWSPEVMSMRAHAVAYDDNTAAITGLLGTGHPYLIKDMVLDTFIYVDGKLEKYRAGTDLHIYSGNNIIVTIDCP